MSIKEEYQEEYDAWLKRLGKTVAALRKEQGLTQCKMAIKTGFDMKYYQDIEYGRRPITTRTLHQLCKGIGISMAALVAKVDNNALAYA